MPTHDPQTGSDSFRTFYQQYMSDTSGDIRDTVYTGLDERIFARLTAEERMRAEEMMLDKLQNSTDTRLAIGLGLLKSVPAVPLLRRGLKRFFPLSPAIRIAFALALWRIDGDAAMVDVIVKALKARSTDTTTRGDGVRALAQIPTEASRAALFDLLRSDPEYLVRYHSFAGLLRLYGYDRAEADREVGAAAPHIARMLKDPAAGERVLATLATLIRGRSLGNAP